MWPFGKKKKPNPEYIPPATQKKECDHKYRDFSWYALGSYNVATKTYTGKIFEPYVCIHCGHRKDVLLEDTCRWPMSYEETKEAHDQFQEPYKEQLKERAFVEDEINDMLLVDRSYINFYLTLQNPPTDMIHKYYTEPRGVEHE